eukprot:scaffold426_cov319-Pavlova_lutheri.AAC.21
MPTLGFLSIARFRANSFARFPHENRHSNGPATFEFFYLCALFNLALRYGSMETLPPPTLAWDAQLPSTVRRIMDPCLHPSGQDIDLTRSRSRCDSEGVSASSCTPTALVVPQKGGHRMGCIWT